MEYLLVGLCIAFCAYRSFKIGLREGSEITIKKLHEEKIISIRTNGDIVPNPFYIETDS